MPHTVHSRGYRSFSGVDIHVVFGGRLVGELQGISWTVTREKAPLYTMGDPNVRAYSRGKRGIAGSLVFLQFDRDGLLTEMASMRRMRYVARIESLRRRFGVDAEKLIRSGALGADQVLEPNATGSVGSSAFGDPNRIRVSNQLVWARPQYLDQIPPMNVVIQAANEYGNMMKRDIKGLEIMNMGSGTSIDDITIDQTCTFVATDITPWYNQGYVDSEGVWHDIDVSSGGEQPPRFAGSEM